VIANIQDQFTRRRRHATSVMHIPRRNLKANSTMKRFLLTCMVLSLAAVPLLGCQEEATTERTTTVTTPGGETTTTDTHKVESTGENPPPNPQGETAR
jgi:hypothetical protein